MRYLPKRSKNRIVGMAYLQSFWKYIDLKLGLWFAVSIADGMIENNIDILYKRGINMKRLVECFSASGVTRNAAWCDISETPEVAKF